MLLWGLLLKPPFVLWIIYEGIFAELYVFYEAEILIHGYHRKSSMNWPQLHFKMRNLKNCYYFMHTTYIWRCINLCPLLNTNLNTVSVSNTRTVHKKIYKKIKMAATIQWKLFSIFRYVVKHWKEPRFGSQDCGHHLFNPFYGDIRQLYISKKFFLEHHIVDYNDFQTRREMS